MKNALVSIIITTKNEEDVIRSLFQSIEKQTYPSIEILLLDNNSADRTKEIAQEYTKRVYNCGPERSTQRNTGAEKAKGSFLLFLDADMELQPDVVSQCVVQITPEDVGAVIIPEKSFGESFWAKVKSYERSFYVGDESIEAARFYRKETFDLLGGFDQNITGPEDWDLSDRVRKEFAIRRIQSYILHNEGNLGLWELLKKKYYYGIKTPRYLRKNGKETAFSPKTIFFLRRSFYRHPRKIFAHPVMFCAMIFMLSSELLAGIFGVIAGSTHE